MYAVLLHLILNVYPTLVAAITFTSVANLCRALSTHLFSGLQSFKSLIVRNLKIKQVNLQLILN